MPSGKSKPISFHTTTDIYPTKNTDAKLDATYASGIKSGMQSHRSTGKNSTMPSSRSQMTSTRKAKNTSRFPQIDVAKVNRKDELDKNRIRTKLPNGSPPISPLASPLTSPNALVMTYYTKALSPRNYKAIFPYHKPSGFVQSNEKRQKWDSRFGVRKSAARVLERPLKLKKNFPKKIFG